MRILYSLLMLVVFASMSTMRAGDMSASDEATDDQKVAPAYKADTPQFTKASEPIQVERPLAQLYDNGPLITHPGGGFGGADASALQNTFLNTYGSNQNATTYRIADDFTVSGGAWTIDSIALYGYQTGSTTTSTFTAVYLQIWDGPPNNPGSNLLFGDLTTNRLVRTGFSNIYRVLITTLTDVNRPIMRNVVSVGTTLQPGSYWLVWASSGSLASGPWQPFVTILGTYTTGNALQYTGAAWQAIRDSVSPNPGNPQGVPFTIYGTSTSGTPPLNPFTLQTPTAGITITTLNGSTTPIVATWDTSTSVATYKWIFGSPTVPPRQIAIPTTSNQLSTTLGALDLLLAGLGVAPGDSLIGQWDVWAFRNNSPDFDSLKSSNGPRAIILKRGIVPCLTDYSVVRTTGITFNSIASTGSSFSSWRAGTSIDDNRSAATPIGFTFTYLGVDYTSFSASTNGHMDISSSAATGTGTGAYGYQNTQFSVSSGTLLAFAPMYDDLIFPTGTAQANMMRYQLDGTAPNRVLTVEWVGAGFYNVGAVDGNLNFQVKLYETSNKIEFVYGPITAPTSVAPTYTVGINAATMSGTPTACELLTQQTANSATFGNTPQNSLATVPEANTMISFTLSSTSVDPGLQTTPVEFALRQNYPNPFNPSTTIQYSLPEPSIVTLRVFNILGQEVTTLVNDVQQASHHSVVWDGKNATGNTVSTGVYFYRLTAKSVSGKTTFADMKKMLFVK